MVGVIEGLGSLKTAMEAVGGFNAAIGEVKVAEAKIAITGLLIDAQMAMLDAQRTLLEDTDTIRALEARIMELEDWSAEAERYELAAISPGVLAYRLKNPEESSEPPHWLCPRCFPHRTKSFLQMRKHPGMTETRDCPECNCVLVVRGQIANIPQTRGAR